MRRIFLVGVLCISTCSGQTQEDKMPSPLVDLVESTRIIRAVISNNKLGELLQERDEEQVSLILDNFSPALLAFTSEVRDSTVPLLMLYFFKDSPRERIFIEKLRSLAQEYNERIKFVVIDVEKLPMIAEELDVEKAPTIFLMQNNNNVIFNVLFEMHENITIDALERAITNALLAPRASQKA